MDREVEEEGYGITSTTFLGSEKFKAYNIYTYKISFNKSLDHTLRYEGIEKGLDMYVKYENSWGIKRWLIKKLMGFKH